MTNLLVLLWSYPVISFFYIIFTLLTPSSIKINYERAVYAESFVNATLCSYYSFVYPDNIIKLILIGHLISDLIYLCICRPNDYPMFTHHIITLIAMSIIFEIQTYYNILAIGIAEVTNILFNTKLLLKSYGKRVPFIDNSFYFSFIFLRLFITPSISIAEFYYTSHMDKTFILYSYYTIIILLNLIGYVFSYQLYTSFRRKSNNKIK